MISKIGRRPSWKQVGATLLFAVLWILFLSQLENIESATGISLEAESIAEATPFQWVAYTYLVIVSIAVVVAIFKYILIPLIRHKRVVSGFDLEERSGRN